MQNYGNLEARTFHDHLFIKKNATREQQLQVNQKHGFTPKVFNNDTYASDSGTDKSTLKRHRPKVN